MTYTSNVKTMFNKRLLHIISLLIMWLVINGCDENLQPEDQMSAGTMSAGTMTAGEMTAGEMTAGEMTAGEMTAGEMTAGEMTAGEMTAGEMTAGEMTAGEMTAGEMTAGEMTAGEITAGEMTAGEMTAGEMTAGEMTAGEMTAGEMMTLVQCEMTWLALTDDSLVEALYRNVSETYEPIIPGEDLGGNINRYTTARSIMFSEIERRENQAMELGIYTIYTNLFTALPPNTEPDHGDVNCEHTWPRSRLIDEDEEPTLYSHQQSDLHHLLPARSVINSLRGSDRFGEPAYVMEDQYAPAVSGQDSDGHNLFSLIEVRRGDVARVIFYMSIRWGLDIIDYEEQTLRSWHLADPVDNWERERNTRIASYQGNRNPFIDCPELVDRIDDFVVHSYSTLETLPTP